MLRAYYGLSVAHSNYCVLVLMSRWWMPNMIDLDLSHRLRKDFSHFEGNGMETTLMSDEERRFSGISPSSSRSMSWGCCLQGMLFVSPRLTIFMGPGYDIGDGSIWRRSDNPIAPETIWKVDSNERATLSEIFLYTAFRAAHGARYTCGVTMDNNFSVSSGLKLEVW